MRSTTALVPASSKAPSIHDRNYATALHHAHQIQLQKETSALILASTETLLDTPISLTSSTSRPSEPDIQTIKTLLPPFQPADLDALIHERNIISKCGYPLCANPPALQPTTAKYRLLFGKGHGTDALRVVERQELEKWCSDECGRRALFLRIQLREEPAWLRGGDGQSLQIKILEEENEGEEEILSRIRKLEISDRGRGIDEQMKALAIERGDEKRSGKATRLADVGIKENEDASKSTPVAPKEATNGAGAIEGYMPKNKVLNGVSGDSDTDEDGHDIMDTI